VPRLQRAYCKKGAYVRYDLPGLRSVIHMKHLEQRRANIARALALHDQILLIGAGEPIPLPEGSDQTYPFRAHSEYYYLTGIDSPGGVLAFDPRQHSARAWVSFAPEVTETEKTWEGKAEAVGTPLARLEAWLGSRRGRPIITLGAQLRGVRSDEGDIARTREEFTHVRRVKDQFELDLLRRAVLATAKGFAAIRHHIRPGVTERQLRIELEAEFFRNGADNVGFESIVGSGPNAAVMHFSPSQRKIRRGDFVLIDAGAEVQRYVADVTRTFVAGKKPTQFQRDLLRLVLAAERAAIDRCIPRAEWKEIHLKAASELTAGLIELKLMKGHAESLVEQGAYTLFFPHGVGHLVGLGVRDASGRYPGRLKDESAALRNLRMDLPLAAGYVTTVEPGLYFIPAILQDPKRRKRYRHCVNWQRVDKHVGLGGVRIEDTVLVTDDGPVVLTAAIPSDQ
jgi:Xaa-Pro aminopeptidase